MTGAVVVDVNGRSQHDDWRLRRRERQELLRHKQGAVSAPSVVTPSACLGASHHARKGSASLSGNNKQLYWQVFAAMSCFKRCYANNPAALKNGSTVTKYPLA